MPANKTLMEKITQGRQYRSMANVELREKENPDSFIVEGYATTYNEPYCLGEDENIRIMEQVSPDAFKDTRLDDCIFQYDHEGRVYARTSNGTLTLQSDSHGLKIVADLGGTEEGRKLYNEIKGGYTNRMSFGFRIDDDKTESYTDKDGKRVYLRTITKIAKLFDVSAVSLPANDGTEISARNYCEGVFQDVEKRIADDEANKKAEEEKKQQEEKEKRERARLRALAL